MKSPEALRKAAERTRRREAGEYHLQRWIPGAARAEIEAAIDEILASIDRQNDQTTAETNRKAKP